MSYNNQRIRVYSITFNEYTNCLHNTVAHNERDMDYIDIPRNTPFLILESEIDFYRQYGGGINSMIQVGEIIHKPCPFKFDGQCPLEIKFPEPINVKLIDAVTDRVDYCPDYLEKCEGCIYKEKCNVITSKEDKQND